MTDTVAKSKYKLLFHSHHMRALSILMQGTSCRVIAVPEYYKEPDGELYNLVTYSEPMTLSEAKEYIATHPEMLGKDIEECKGLHIRDIDFGEPINTKHP